ncbi:hypothetical protein PTTG_12268 [Puccinia triticina 1-1 BBBD Race 1]|uniref:Uncharacterized protein n=2 Tax=Puccinia triticina TaxID=208348 RepID=A0A180GH27_PUCT1|nr:uncharacterized protein PtA15_11A391 [Puccinia triticina]OAV92046.1 hypothetical protein PTTG_12268 [Puccinia triticina 1-1 BBBD Race 1]WAQ89700.1 hypothetical protein PtA15_11A391 [Puccinia triticina]
MSTPFIVFCLASCVVCSVSLNLPTYSVEKTIITADDGLELPDLNEPAPVRLSFEESSTCGQTIMHWSHAPGPSHLPGAKHVKPAMVSKMPSQEDTISHGQHPSGGPRKQKTVDLDSDQSPKRSKFEQDHRIQTSEGGTKQPMEIASFPVEISENGNNFKEAGQDIPHSTSYDSRRKVTSQATQPAFKVYDWDFLRARGLDDGTSNEPQKIELVSLFKDFRFEVTGGFYWVHPMKLQEVRRNFRQNRHKLNRNLKLLNSTKKGELLGQLVLKLSDEKLALDQYPTFSAIKSEFESKLGERTNELGKLANPPQISIRKIKSIQIFANNVSKISTFLAIFHLSLFKQHDVSDGDQFLLSRKTVEDILVFLRKFWTELVFADNQPSKHESVTELSEMLRFQLHSTFDNCVRYDKAIWYRRAWSVVDYWAVQHGKRSIAKDGQDTFPVELVNNMLLYSNPTFFSQPSKKPRSPWVR